MSTRALLAFCNSNASSYKGVHEVEVDRIDESEEGTHFAVLVYPEGEVTIQTEYLPEGVNIGSRLHYDPANKSYR